MQRPTSKLIHIPTFAHSSLKVPIRNYNQVNYSQRGLGFEGQSQATKILPFKDYRDLWTSVLIQYQDYFGKITFGAYNLLMFDVVSLPYSSKQNKLPLSKPIKQDIEYQLLQLAQTCPQYGDQNWAVEFYSDVNSKDADLHISLREFFTYTWTLISSQWVNFIG